MDNEYLSEFRVGDVDCFSLGDIDMTQQVVEYANGTRPIVEANITHTISNRLIGIFAILKEEYREEDGYHIRVLETFEWEGQIETLDTPYAFDNIDSYHTTEYPYANESMGNFLHVILVITNMTPFDEPPLNSKNTIHKAYGVKFILGDPTPGPPPAIQDIESELFIKMAGQWFRLVDKVN